MSVTNKSIQLTYRSNDEHSQVMPLPKSEDIFVQN